MNIDAGEAALAAGRDHQPAVVSGSGSLSYGELAARADRLARAMAGPELAPHRFLLVTGDAAEVAVAVVAAARAGAALLLLDAQSTAVEVDQAAALFGVNATLRAGAIDLGAPRHPAPPPWPAGLGLITSGTEGLPKCVERPWATAVANAAAFARALGLAPGETLASTTRPHHSYAVCGGVLAALGAGATYLALHDRPGPAAVAAALDAHPATCVLSVPLLYRWFASAPLRVAHPPRLWVSAATALPPADRDRWATAVGGPLVEHYGSSELGMLTLDMEGVPGSVGRPIDGVELRLSTLDGTGSPLREVLARVAGAPGRLLRTGEPARPLAGWLPTGDVGRLDADGRLYLLGRRGDVMNVAGNKVSTAEVEAAARAYPGVTDCVAAGLPDGSGNVRVGLFVEADPPVPTRDMVAFLRTRLAAGKVPTVVVALARLPRNPAGKVRRAELVAHWTASGAGGPGPGSAPPGLDRGPQ